MWSKLPQQNVIAYCAHEKSLKQDVLYRHQEGSIRFPFYSRITEKRNRYSAGLALIIVGTFFSGICTNALGEGIWDEAEMSGAR